MTTKLTIPGENMPITTTHDNTTPRSDNGPLSPAQQRELVEANRRARKIVRATKVAAFNGWSFGLFAALTLPFALFSLTSLVMGLGLAAVAYNELRGRRLLCNFDPNAPRILGWNQLGLMGLLIAYSLWNIWIGFNAPSPYSEEIAATPELGPMLGSIDDLYRQVTLIVYGGLIVFSVIFQGLNALYYFTREKHLQSYLNQTPAWVVDLQRTASVSGL